MDGVSDSYPFFHTSFLLFLLLPVYLGSIVAALLFRPGCRKDSLSNVPWTEIVATSAAAAFLLCRHQFEQPYGSAAFSAFRKRP